MIELLVLKGRTRLAREPEPSRSERYDAGRQLWVDLASGLPLIEVMRGRTTHTSFGETLTTESREGTDQSEITSLMASQFGETMVTKSQEGHDQTGESTMASTVGETVNTYTREGADSTETTSVLHAAYSHL